MKRFFILILSLMIVLPGFGQRIIEYWSDGPDTSTTVVAYNTGGTAYSFPFKMDVNIYVNVTGTESATLKVELKPYGGATFFPIKTWTAITADGYYRYTGYALGGTLRVSILSTDSGNAATTTDVCISKDPNASRPVDYWTDGPDTSTTTVVALAGGGVNNFDFYYDMGILLDVVADTATLYVDYQPKGSSTWHPIDTVASAKADTYYFYQGSAVGGKLRARVLSDGTGSSALTVWTQYAKKDDD